jgi:hypothetical protein
MPLQVTRFVDGYTSFEITRVDDLLDGSGYTQKSLCMVCNMQSGFLATI